MTFHSPDPRSAPATNTDGLPPDGQRVAGLVIRHAGLLVSNNLATIARPLNLRVIGSLRECRQRLVTQLKLPEDRLPIPTSWGDGATVVADNQ